MTVALAFAVFAASAAAQDPQAIKPFPVAIVCTKSAEKVSSGLSKICYYSFWAASPRPRQARRC
jgi:hypothetical protein